MAWRSSGTTNDEMVTNLKSKSVSTFEWCHAYPSTTSVPERSSEILQRGPKNSAAKIRRHSDAMSPMKGHRIVRKSTFVSSEEWVALRNSG